MAKYDFTDDMNEISGFGGNYEDCCRRMLKGGMEWFDANPKADPQFHGFKGFYGVIAEDNAEAKSLSKAIIAAAGEYGPTGAMHQAVVSACMFIKAKGWDEYVKQMTHPQGQVGILKEKLASALQDLGSIRKRSDEAEEESRLRGIIIAEAIWGWEAHPVRANAEQRCYAPDAETALKLNPGQHLCRFIDEEMLRVHARRADKRKSA